ncbi:hypothetical protein DFQ26_003879 [Actinomortierella ambigua]|nr:hypothetical protein DFQ26_003879 [Actinomortierella ambigua]
MTHDTVEHELYEIKSDFLKKSKFEVYYMETRARAELPRLLLEFVGASYTNRAPADWPKGKKDTLFGYLPQLIHTKPDGTTFEMSETKALTRYLSRLFGLVGTNVEENATLDMLLSCIIDNIMEVMADEVWKKPNPNDEAAFERFAESAKYFLNGLERFLVKNGSNGFFLHSKTTYPDIAYYDWMEHFFTAYPIGAAKAFKEERPATFKLYQRLNSHPRLRAYIDGGRWKHRSSSPFLGMSTAGYFTKDWEKALEFYKEKLGLECTMNVNPAPAMDANQRYLEFSLPYSKTKFTLFCPGTLENMDKRGGDMVTFNVHSVQDAYDDLSKKGVEFKFAPKTETWGVHTQLVDPDEIKAPMSLPLASIRRSSAKRLPHCSTRPCTTTTTATRPLMDTRETRHWIQAMYRMTLRQPLSLTHPRYHLPSTSRSFGHSSHARSRLRSPRLLSWSSNDIFKPATTNVPSTTTTSSTPRSRMVDRTNKLETTGSLKFKKSPSSTLSPSSSSSSSSSFGHVSRDRIESIAQYPEQAAREMLEPNVSLLLRTSPDVGGGASGSRTAQLVTPKQQQQPQQQQIKSRSARSEAAGSKTTQDLLRFDPFSTRSLPSSGESLFRTASFRSTMRSQQSMWAARRDHQRAPEYMLQDMQALSANSPASSLLPPSSSSLTFSKDEDDIFRQYQQLGAPPPSLETLLLDRPSLQQGSTWTTTSTQFSGFSPRDFMPLSANNRLAMDLFRSDQASQEHVILARPSANAGASTGVIQEGVQWGNTNTNTNTNSPAPLAGSTVEGLCEALFADEYDSLAKTLFRGGKGLSRTAFEAELQRFGSVVHERLLDVPSFVQSAWSRQDLMILGLERVVQEAMAPRIGAMEKVQLAALMVRHDVHGLLSVATLQAWQDQVLAQGTPELFQATKVIDKATWQTTMETTLEQIRSHRGKMTKEAWEVRTMPFRTKLAIFRKSGILPTKGEYGAFMVLGLKAERYEQVYQAFHHLVEHGGAADTRLYTMYITALARQGRMDHAQEVLRGMERMSVAPSVVTYGVMIDGYGKQQDGAGMLAMLQEMHRTGLEPNLPIFSSLLANLIRSREFFKALKVHDRLVASQLEMDDTTRNSLIKLLQHTKGSQAAYLSLLERLGATDDQIDHHSSTARRRNRHGPSSSATTASTTKKTTSFKERGGDVDEAAVAAEAIRESPSAEVAGFNKVLDGFAQAVDVVQFTAAYRAMQKRGLSPNRYTYNTLLKFYKRSGSALQNSLEVLKEMNAKYPLMPDVVAYTTVMQHAAAVAMATAGKTTASPTSPSSSSTASTQSNNNNKNGSKNKNKNKNSGSSNSNNSSSSNSANDATPMDVAWDLYDEMMQRQVRPDLVTYSTLIEMVGQDPSCARARTMIRRHFITGPHHHPGFTVSAECDRATGIGLAGQLYVQLLNQGLVPNEVVLGSLMHVLIRHGFIHEVEGIYSEMIGRKGMVPNTALLTNLIQGFGHVRDFEAGWKVWEFMVAQGVPRNAITYSHLVRLCERSFHPNYLEAMWWHQQKQQQRQQEHHSQLSRRAGSSSHEFDQYGVRIDRYGEEGINHHSSNNNRSTSVNRPSSKRLEKSVEKGRALGLSDTADRAMTPPPGAGYVDRYALPATDASDATATSSDGAKKSRIREWVPTEICEVIERQMKADGVSWSKVQRFRKGIREMKPSDPIVAHMEQLSLDDASPTSSSSSMSSASALSDDPLDTATVAAAPVPAVVGLSEALVFEPLMTKGGRRGRRQVETGTQTQTLEVAGPGLGHDYVPQRTLPPNVYVAWGSEAHEPVVREWKEGEDAEYQRLDSKAVLRQYPFLMNSPSEWHRAYRAGVIEPSVSASSSSSSSSSSRAGGMTAKDEQMDAAHVKRVQKMEKRRVKALRTPAKSSWTEEAIEQMEEEERAYAIPGRS